jgi:SAM-dependent methyltransferase
VGGEAAAHSGWSRLSDGAILPLKAASKGCFVSADQTSDAYRSLEARLATLEVRELRLREFIVPAFWDALDRLYARTETSEDAACLACATLARVSSFPVRTDKCLFGGGKLERLECMTCGCVFGPLKYLQTPDDVISADYRLLYSYYTEADSTDDEIRAFELLDPRPGGLYLNWGSGAWSRSVEMLRARGHDVWGYEPNAATASPFVVRNRGEISARFDGIFSNNVIEHLLAPADQFLDFHRILKPGGRMAHASPCYQWSYAFTRFHVFFPLGRAPEALAARTGFRIGRSVDDDPFRAVVFERDQSGDQPA